MDRLSITIDVSKISKDKIISRTYNSKDGEVTAKDLKLEIIPLREPKLVKDGGDWQIWKTHFVAEAQSKEERANNVKSNIIGDGVMFKKPSEDNIIVDDDLDTSSVPF